MVNESIEGIDMQFENKIKVFLINSSDQGNLPILAVSIGWMILIDIAKVTGQTLPRDWR